MNVKKLVKELMKNPTIAFQALGTVAGALLLNLLQLYVIACENGINVENSFIIDYEILTEFLGMDIEWLDDAALTLDRLEFVDMYVLSEETSENWVFIYFETIEKFFKEFEQKTKASMQVELLKCSTFKSVGNLCKSTEKLRKFVQKHSDKIIPTATYALCDNVISEYEENMQQPFTKIPHFWNSVSSVLKKTEFMPNQLHRWITHIMVNHLNQLSEG